MAKKISLVLLVVLLGAGAVEAQQNTPSLEVTLERLRDYLTTYHDAYAAIVSDERYRQRDGPADRVLDSLLERSTSPRVSQQRACSTTSGRAAAPSTIPQSPSSSSIRSTTHAFSFRCAATRDIDHQPVPVRVDAEERLTLGLNFARDPAVDLWVPVRMRERHQILTRTLQSGEATYTNFRRFAVQSRIVVSEP
jgi:hypothetical protein